MILIDHAVTSNVAVFFLATNQPGISHATDRLLNRGGFFIFSAGGDMQISLLNDFQAQIHPGLI
jgi:hypothetical protein